MADEIGLPSGVSLVAIGGYGRGMLTPGSDLDLLVLHDADSSASEIAAIAEKLFYPLWDAGLEIGHNVRTVAECIEQAESRLDVRTSMLDAHCVAGDAALADELVGRLSEFVRRDPMGLAIALRADAHDRRTRGASVAWHLEPDLKEGAGGLRDIHALRWLAVGFGGSGLETLVDAGLLGAREVDALEEAEDALLRVRCGLHLVEGGRSDLLVLDHQAELAAALGFTDAPDLAAPDALMRSIFEQGREVAFVFDVTMRRFFEPDDHALASVDQSPVGVLTAFADAAERGVDLAPALLDQIEAIPRPDEIDWDEPTREAFLRIIATGETAAAALEGLDRAGWLVPLLPAWAAVRCRPQRDPFHRFTVDVHLLHALAAMGRLTSESGRADDPIAGAAARVLMSAHGLVDAARIGALLHDIGKTGEGAHVAIGAELAAEVLGRGGFDEETTGLVSFLVADHLLLPDTATRRDLTDESLILAVAARIGSPQRLAALYLLALADAEATGSSANTPWRLALIRELVAKIQHVLERGEVTTDTNARLQAARRAIADRLPALDAEAKEDFLSRMPPSYLLSVPPELAASHAPLLAGFTGGEDGDPLEIRTDVRPGEAPGSHVLSVACADRPGLLSKIAGALTLAGLSILSAQVFTTDDGIAVDLFEVRPAFAEEDVDDARWTAFVEALGGALAGKVSLDARVREKRARYPAPGDLPIRVRADDEASDFFTVIEIGCADRIGLLFDLTRTLADLALDVRLAKVATYGTRVVDAFYVRDVLGEKITDPAQIAEIDRAITARLSER